MRIKKTILMITTLILCMLILSNCTTQMDSSLPNESTSSEADSTIIKSSSTPKTDDTSNNQTTSSNSALDKEENSTSSTSLPDKTPNPSSKSVDENLTTSSSSSVGKTKPSSSSSSSVASKKPNSSSSTTKPDKKPIHPPSSSVPDKKPSSSSSSVVDKKPPTSSSFDYEVVENPTDDKVNMKIKIEVSGKIFTATLQDNITSRSFLERLPMTLDMGDLNQNEKYFFLPSELPTKSERIQNIKNGDIMLYGSDCLVLFYENFSSSYSYTHLGVVDDITGFVAALGEGSVTVTWKVDD